MIPYVIVPVGGGGEEMSRSDDRYVIKWLILIQWENVFIEVQHALMKELLTLPG